MLETLHLIIRLLPALARLVETAENLFPEGGKGAAKLALVKEWLALAGFDDPGRWALVETLIAGLVKAFNAAGKFKSAAPDAHGH